MLQEFLYRDKTSFNHPNYKNFSTYIIYLPPTTTQLIDDYIEEKKTFKKAFTIESAKFKIILRLGECVSINSASATSFSYAFSAF